MKPISITLTQETDGKSFRVASFSNTHQLTVGMIVDRDRVEKWIDLPGVSVNVRGMTPDNSNEAQTDLFESAKQHNGEKTEKRMVIAK